MKTCIRNAREGNPQARHELVEALRPRITKMAAYYGRCTGEDPDDLLQEAWIGLFEGLAEVDLHIGTPEHYLTARARWKVLDAVKRNKVRRCAPLDDAAYELIPDTGAENALDYACATEFVDQLKDNHQEIIDCLMDGLTWRETGDRLGCASANIAYHVRKIRRQYEEWLDESACTV